MNKIISLTSVLALSTIALTGCVSVSSPTVSTSTNSSKDIAYEGAAMGGGGDYASSGQSIIANASVFLTGDDPTAVSEEIISSVEDQGGRIDGQSSYSDQDGRTSGVSLTVRIPSEQLDSFLESMSDFGTVQSKSKYATDVTTYVTDNSAQIESVQASIDRLTELQRQAKTTQDLIDIESAITDRQSTLSWLLIDQRNYENQIGLSTVQVEIGLPSSATDPVPDTLWDGIVAGWKGLLAFLAGIVVAIGVVIPWIPFLALVAWVGLVLYRRFGGKKAKPVQVPRPARTAATKTAAKPATKKR